MSEPHNATVICPHCKGEFVTSWPAQEVPRIKVTCPHCQVHVDPSQLKKVEVTDGLPDQCTTDKAYAEKEPAWTPMYYKHEWVGLTDEDFYGQSELQRLAMRYAEAKLKEKNG